MGCSANPMKVKNMVVDAHYRAAASCMRQVALNVFLACMGRLSRVGNLAAIGAWVRRVV